LKVFSTNHQINFIPSDYSLLTWANKNNLPLQPDGHPERVTYRQYAKVFYYQIFVKKKPHRNEAFLDTNKGCALLRGVISLIRISQRNLG